MKVKVVFCAFVISALTLAGCSSATTTTPSTTSTSQLGASISSPAPVGLTVSGIIECGTGYTSHELYDIKVTTLEVIRGDEAWENIQAASSSNEPPEPGFDYVLARIRFGFFARGAPGDLYHQLIGAQFVAFSKDGKQYQTVSIVPPEPELSGTLYSGDTVEGWVALQVPKEDDKPLMCFDASIGGAEAVEHGGNIWFQLY